MQQLTELHLGNAEEEVNGSINIYSVDGFITVLNALEQIPKLTTLVMQLPHIIKLNINRGWKP
jgi:hypothetical protein